MNLVDVIVILTLFAVLVLLFYLTRNKKKDTSGCVGCHNNCSSCTSYSSLFEDYKKDHPDKEA